MDIKIKRIDDELALGNSVKVIRESFMTVAKAFKLTEENAPTNAAFIALRDLLKMKERNAHMYGLYNNGLQVGFFSIEPGEDKLYYLNKVAVLPEYRHRGYGKSILDYAVWYIKENGGGKISIGIIDKNVLLKDWYINYGFIEKAKKSYTHLPFEVCLMEINI